MVGMDSQTLGAYDRRAADYANEWEDEQPAPADLHAIINEFFFPGPTADIGCGSGRDTAWLNEHGFQAVGYDPSPALLEEARRRHPTVRFELDELPELETIAPASFANVLCETVVMHLPPAMIAPSVTRLLEILAPDGTLYLSWRVIDGAPYRDDDGRLYSAFPSSAVTDALQAATILHDAESASASSGATIHRVVARKHDS